jgi:hypothetical protein
MQFSINMPGKFSTFKQLKQRNNFACLLGDLGANLRGRDSQPLALPSQMEADVNLWSFNVQQYNPKSSHSLLIPRPLAGQRWPCACWGLSGSPHHISGTWMETAECGELATPLVTV